LENASIVERSVAGNRRITGKQSMTQITISRTIKAAVKLAKGKNESRRTRHSQTSGGRAYASSTRNGSSTERETHSGNHEFYSFMGHFQAVQTWKDEEQKALADQKLGRFDALRRSGRSAVASSGERTGS
jgi:hypothetical protein